MLMFLSVKVTCEVRLYGNNDCHYSREESVAFVKTEQKSLFPPSASVI